MKKKLIASLLASLMIGASAVTFAAPLKDVPSNHWAYDAVEMLNEDGFLLAPKGKLDGNGNATFYDLAFMVGRLLELNDFDALGPGFPDVPKKHPAYHYVLLVQGSHVMEGYGDGKFYGDNQITRFELALTLANFFDSDPNLPVVTFTDVPANHWAYPAVTTLGSRHIMEGYGDGSFLGDRNITRYEMALVFAKFLSNLSD